MDGQRDGKSTEMPRMDDVAPANPAKLAEFARTLVRLADGADVLPTKAASEAVGYDNLLIMARWAYVRMVRTKWANAHGRGVEGDGAVFLLARCRVAAKATAP